MHPPPPWPLRCPYPGSYSCFLDCSARLLSGVCPVLLSFHSLPLLSTKYLLKKHNSAYILFRNPIHSPMEWSSHSLTLSFIERAFSSCSHLLLHACPLTATPKPCISICDLVCNSSFVSCTCCTPQSLTWGSIVLHGHYWTPPLLLGNCRRPACLCLVLSYLRRTYFTLTPQGLKQSQVCHGCKVRPC